MTAAGATTQTPAGSDGSRSSPWLHGPVPDLLLGCGALYLVFFALLLPYGPAIRAASAPYLLPLLVLLFSMPHYGATLVRVYEDRKDRRAYALFSIWITIALFGLFVAGVHFAIVGSVLLTIYLTWSPWHYTGQNYGIAVMFLRRRGVELDPLTKRSLYFSFLASYVLVFCVFHGMAGGAISYDRFSFDQTTVTFLPLGFPPSVIRPFFVAVAIGYGVTTLFAIARLLQRASFAALCPALLLVLAQAIWFSVPFAVLFWQAATGFEAIDKQSAARDYVLYVAIAHAVQYLWVTSYFARATPSWGNGVGYGAKVAAAGIALWTLPVVLFSPDLLGRASYDAGLSLVLAATINIHHFVLDGAIWKLRNTRIGNVLIRSGRTEDDTVAQAMPAMRAAVWAACALGAVVALYTFVEMEVRLGRRVAERDWSGAQAILDRTSWFGRDEGGARRTVARKFYDAGDKQAAIDNYERAIALKPDAAWHGELGFIHQELGDLDAALASYRGGLAVAPDHAALLLFLGRAELAAGETQRAVETLTRLESLAPDNEQIQQALAQARAAAAEAD